MSNCGEHEPFALQVTDDTMAPEFPRGCVVVIEPARSAMHGSYVICRYQGELLFRQFLQTGLSSDRFVLHALDTAVRDIELSGQAGIVGRVVRRNGRRRRDAKTYGQV